MEPSCTHDRSLYGTSGALGVAVWGGFFVSVPLWLSWYITHLPWVQLSEQQSLPLVLGAWTLALLLALYRLASPAPIRAGASIGLASAVIGLLVLGSKIVAPAATGSGASAGVVPNALWIVLGFIAMGTVLGTVAGTVAIFFKAKTCSCAGSLEGMAKVAVLIAAPLLFAGGLVTSTDSGMAVPDWPNTFGTNMFLYPLGPRVQPVVGQTYASIYLEHAHRLFGALVGFATLCLTVWVNRREPRRWVRVLVYAVFAVVVLQGLLGGLRVVQNQRVMAMFHGVSAQLIFAGLVVVAAVLSSSFRAETPLAGMPNAKRMRMFTGAAVHASILQLFLGALYRHFRDGPGGGHALWTHVGFSLFVLAMGTIGGALAAGAELPEGRTDPLVRSIRRAGLATMLLVGLQFTLGWFALLLGGKGTAAPSVAHALLRTAHQANGALMLAAMTFAAVYARRLWWRMDRPVSEVRD